MNKNTNKKKSFFVFLFTSLALPISYVFAQAPPVPDMVENIENAFITIGGSIVVIGWIIAGILYLTSAGNPEKTGIAKKALFAAVIGTALIILARFAYNLVVGLLNPGAIAP